MIETILLSATIAISAFVVTVGQRYAQRFIRTPTDDRQDLSLQLQVEALRKQEERFATELKARRDLQLEVLEKQFEHDRSEADRKYELARWPFKITPPVFLKSSMARNGRALNLIVCVRSSSSENAKSDAGLRSLHGLKLLESCVTIVERETVGRYGGSMFLYDETRKPIELSHTTLQNTGWSLLRTEPTILFYIQQSAPLKFHVDISFWGMGYDADIGPEKLSSIKIDLNDVDGSDSQRGRLLAAVLSTLVVGFGDTFNSLHNASELPQPVFPWLVKQVNAAELPANALDFLSNTYSGSIATLSQYSPSVAIEIGLQAALALYEVGLAEQSRNILNVVLQTYKEHHFSEVERLEDAVRTIQNCTLTEAIGKGTIQDGAYEAAFRGILSR
jgi:hypothetical protein